ncbi:MAG: DegT/DnrJ/EryC1/StrS family aminotransferase [Deferribacteres bacterium]|nr:DegT/DnrJ/EryC1/StrS family aminotransferase [candidate division KSB1 bacterium]MCB9501969.1 DegT/DnrJ/EryC1/StrS family aminotransferase [Deferribacteres bacterium]
MFPFDDVKTESKQIGVGCLQISPLARQYIDEVLDANRLSIGPFVHRFEHDFAHSHGCRYGVMVNSGTSALQIALAALKEKHGWQDGDEVIVPAITFIATSNIVIYNQLTPVFVDVDQFTYNIDPEAIERAITPKTRAIIPVHLFGLPCDMEPIMDIARGHNLAVLEDSCETMFATYRGKSVGSFGDAACFSTYVAHILVTGVGGLVTCNDAELATMCRSYLAHGRDEIYLDIDADKQSDNDLRSIIERRFSFVRLGHSFRPTELEGALGLAQLQEHEENINRRRKNAAYLTKQLTPLIAKIQLPVIPYEREHSFMMFPVTVYKKGERDKLCLYLEEHGIETRYAFPLITQPVYKKIFNLNSEDFPIAKSIGENTFYIGCHPELERADLDYIVEQFYGFYGKEHEKK